MRIGGGLGTMENQSVIVVRLAVVVVMISMVSAHF